jgi:uncharacterized protein (TIGR00645 family)
VTPPGANLVPPPETVVMLVVLGLIDVVMISNLLIMVIVGGYETFVSRMNLDDHPDQPEWLSHVNASVLKVKLATAIIGISSIHLLKTFINAAAYDEKTLMWQTAIHITFLLSALAVAATDRLIATPRASEGRFIHRQRCTDTEAFHGHDPARRLITSIADALQFMSYYHLQDYIEALGEAYKAERRRRRRTRSRRLSPPRMPKATARSARTRELSWPSGRSEWMRWGACRCPSPTWSTRRAAPISIPTTSFAPRSSPIPPVRERTRGTTPLLSSTSTSFRATLWR